MSAPILSIIDNFIPSAFLSGQKVSTFYAQRLCSPRWLRTMRCKKCLNPFQQTRAGFYVFQFPIYDGALIYIKFFANYSIDMKFSIRVARILSPRNWIFCGYDGFSVKDRDHIIFLGMGLDWWALMNSTTRLPTRFNHISKCCCKLCTKSKLFRKNCDL
jgi:hypothetical protein